MTSNTIKTMSAAKSIAAAFFVTVAFTLSTAPHVRAKPETEIEYFKYLHKKGDKELLCVVVDFEGRNLFDTAEETFTYQMDIVGAGFLKGGRYIRLRDEFIQRSPEGGWGSS